jgi:hypothetical protein
MQTLYTSNATEEEFVCPHTHNTLSEGWVHKLSKKSKHFKGMYARSVTGTKYRTEDPQHTLVTKATWPLEFAHPCSRCPERKKESFIKLHVQ